MPRSLVRRSAVLSVLALLFAFPWSRLTAIWGEIGCIADPGGLCRDAASASQADIGCGADPGGGCRQ